MDTPGAPTDDADATPTRRTRAPDATAAARWRRLQELFEGLAERAPDERGPWLAGLPDSDTLKQEAVRLIGLDTSGGGLGGCLRAPATPRAAFSTGQRLGAWRLLQEIGSGGMGTVFLAERADEAFDQRVAIKLLRGIPTRESTERMRRERQILADLAHPHIARLLDGGSTPDGQPYLVMEHVDGVPLNAFCRQRAPSLPERLRLVQKLCAAVQYAHQRLVVHRDLKPANVLVRPDGEPVLLDFGIAKLLGDTAPAQLTGVPWFTPAYASPEQRRGAATGTATDVHALGLLLYEVVTGEAPAGCGRLPRLERNGGARIPADLARIVAQATRTEPDERYASAAALADDLQRYLRGLPVQAAPDRLPYRIGKFVRRHRAAAAVAAVVLAGSPAFVWTLAQERDRALRAEAKARRQTDAAQDVIDYLGALFRSASPQEAGGHAMTARELVDRGRREIDDRLSGAPAQRARLLAALGRIYGEIGLPDAAAESLGRAASVEPEAPDRARRVAWQAEQGRALNLAGRTTEAEAVLRDAAALAEGEAGVDARTIAELHCALGLAQGRNGDAAGGIDTIRRALERVARDRPDDGAVRARCLHALAGTERLANRLAEAEAHAQQALALLRPAEPEDSPETLATTDLLTEIYESQGRYAEGERLLRRMLDVRLRRLDPASAWAVATRGHLAQAVHMQGRTLEAIGLLRENVDRLRADSRRDTEAYTTSLNDLASMLQHAGDHAAALPMFEEALAGAERNAANAPDLVVHRQNCARSLMMNGRLDAAFALLKLPVEGGRESLALDTERGRRLLNLAEWMRLKGRPGEGLRYADAAAAAFAPLYPGRHARQATVARVRGGVLRDLGRLGEAEVELRRAVDVYAGSIGRDANLAVEAELQLAEVLYARDRLDEARAHVDRLGPLLPARFVEGSSVRQRHAALARRLAPAQARGGRS